MGRSALTLLVAAVAAVVLGVIGTVAAADLAATSSGDAAKQANEKDLGVPAGYGSR